MQISQHKGVLIYKGLFARSLVAVPVSYREDVQCIGCMSSFYIAGDVFLDCGDLCLDDQVLSPMDMAMQIFPAR